MSDLSNVTSGYVNPGDFCCAIYSENDFKGETSKYCLLEMDEDVKVFKMGDVLNNTMSSWECGKNVAYNFCKYHEFVDYNCTRDRGESGAGRA